MSFKEHQKNEIVDDDFPKQIYQENEQLAKQHIEKEFIGMNTKTDSHPLINETFKFKENSTSTNDKSLSLILSLRINGQFLLQNQSIDEQQYHASYRSNSELLSPTNDETEIDDQHRSYDMLFPEDHEQNLLAFTSSRDLFLPENPSNQIAEDQPLKMSTSSLTLSLARKPHHTPYQIPNLPSNDTHSITTSINERTRLDERISHLCNIPPSTILETLSANRSVLPSTETTNFKNDHISQWIASQSSNESSIDELNPLPKFAEGQKEINTNIPSVIETEDSIPLSAKQLETLERRQNRDKLQREIITIAKKLLKPSFKKHYITKDVYKIIMKKVVTKATYSNKIDQKWIDKSIHAYVRKYRTV